MRRRTPRPKTILLSPERRRRGVAGKSQNPEIAVVEIAETRKLGPQREQNVAPAVANAEPEEGPVDQQARSRTEVETIHPRRNQAVRGRSQSQGPSPKAGVPCSEPPGHQCHPVPQALPTPRNGPCHRRPNHLRFDQPQENRIIHPQVIPAGKPPTSGPSPRLR